MTDGAVARVEQRIQSLVDGGRVLGMSLAIVDPDGIALAAAFGRTSVEPEGVPVTPETLFDIGSIAKTLCATLVMRLVERGLLDLDRPVVDYLPGFAFSDPRL